LSEPAVLSLLTIGKKYGKVTVDVISGALSSSEPNGRMAAAGARVLGPVPNLKEQLADYDLLVTQYGLSAFEAAAAGISVLLVSPTSYHERLARSVHFLSAGLGRRAASRVASYLPRLEEAATRARAVLGSQTSQSRPAPVNDGARVLPDIQPTSPLARLISGFSFPAGVSCPLCGTRPDKDARILGRFPDRTYRRCASCDMVFLTRIDAPSIQYARDYFFRDYKKQYGKTYLEDFFNLEKAGLARTDRILDLLGHGTEGKVLDIGCAYGPFLSATRSRGLIPHGMDPATDAVRYVRDELEIPAIEGFFPDTDPRQAFGVENFDVVTLWYVIEHFTKLSPVLIAANRLLRTGGVFAFSTPSGEGVSARFLKASFYEHSPADHFSVWEPSRTAATLKRFGFTLEKITVTGHHPERFPGLSRQDPETLAFRLAAAGSRFFGLGDTFEAYAVKTASI
jgi:2-polyprenyl-3-methyl-5-hydroxy-6-metoxy-1,4-benzoquinol methylase